MFKLSVIIPNYNKEKYIGILLNQLKEQITDEVQVIIVDDCSTDNSLSIINQFNDVFEVYKTPQNLFCSGARNYGLQYAQGEYITFLDSDDAINSNYVSKILEDISDSQYDGYFYDYDVISDEPFEKAYNSMVWDKVYRKATLDKYNVRFNEEYYKHYVLCEDLDFNVQFIIATGNIKVLKDCLVQYRFLLRDSVSNGKQVANDDPCFATEYLVKHPEIQDKFLRN